MNNELCERPDTTVVPLALRKLQRVQVQVPPEELFERLWGYSRNERFVVFSSARDQLCIGDGFLFGFGNITPYNIWVNHPSVNYAIGVYNLTGEDFDYNSIAERDCKIHALILDRVHRRVYVGTARDAEKVVKRQGRIAQKAPDAIEEPSSAIMAQDVLPKAEIQRRYKLQYEKTRELQTWLEQRTG